MSTVYNKKDYHRHLQQIMPAGYSMNRYGQYLLADQNNNRTIMISLGGRESFPFGVNFDACSVGITFHEVERIFHNVYTNHSNLSFGHDLDSNTFHDDFSDSVLTRQVIYDDVYPITVEDDASFAQVRPYLQTMLDAAVAFVNAHKTLEDFHNLAEAMPISEMADFYSQPLPERRLIVKKLMGISYDNYATDVINEYNEVGLMNDAVFVQDLKTHLDTL